jgi:hypothetical protein
MRPVRGFVRRDERDERAAAAPASTAGADTTTTAATAHTHTRHARLGTRRLGAFPGAGAVDITYFRVITPLA